jgi:hypothetical protein
VAGGQYSGMRHMNKWIIIKLWARIILKSVLLIIIQITDRM